MTPSAIEPEADMESFIRDVTSLVGAIDDQYELTGRVAARLSALLASGCRLPSEVTRPSDERHVTYPLHIAPDGSWSLASVVWNVGQRTPVHGRRSLMEYVKSLPRVLADYHARVAERLGPGPAA